MKTRKRITLGLSAMALLCGPALAYDSGSRHGRGAYDRSTHDSSTYSRTSGVFAPAAQPTAGGNSAEPDRTGLNRHGEYPMSAHDDRSTPNPRTGEPLPSAGGNSSEPDKTGMDRQAGRPAAPAYDSERAARSSGYGHDGARSSVTRHDRGSYHSEQASSVYGRPDAFGVYPHSRPTIGDPFPTAGGNSAEPERTGQLS